MHLINGVTGVVATVGTQSGSISGVFTFDVPVLVSVADSNAATTGNVLITSIGANLGISDNTQRVRYGMTAAAVTEWTSESSVSGNMQPGVFLSLHATVTMLSHISLSVYLAANTIAGKTTIHNQT